MTEFAFSGVGINPHHGTSANARRADPAEHPGRLDLGRRDLGRRGRRLGRARLRYRRLDPHPGRPAGPGRLQVHGAPGSDRGRGAALDDARHGVRHHPQRPRRHRRARGAGRARGRRRRAATRPASPRDPADARCSTASTRRSAGAFEPRRRRPCGRRRCRSRRSPCRSSPRSRRSTPAAASRRPESWAWHRHLPGRARGRGRPARRWRGSGAARSMSAADYIDLLAGRRDWIARMEAALGAFDALLSPTVPIVAPLREPLVGDDERLLRQPTRCCLRNPSVVNLLDGCAVSLPCHVAGRAAGRPHGLERGAARRRRPRRCAGDRGGAGRRRRGGAAR